MANRSKGQKVNKSKGQKVRKSFPRHTLYREGSIPSRKYMQEFMTICKKLSQDQVDAAFAQFDTSGDDRLDYREFCTFIRRKEEEKEMGEK